MDERLKTVSLRPKATLHEAMRVIDTGAMAIALVLEEGGCLVGTVTDGDIRRALLQGASQSDPVESHMHRDFTAVTPETTRAEVLDLMTARHLQQIPVLDPEGRLVGLHLMREIVGGRKRPNWAVVMAGGKGERLRPITDSIPKPMVPVAGRPILERIVLHLVGYGIRTVYMAVNYRSELIEDHFGDGEKLGCSIRYLKEEKPLGTAGALALLPERHGHPLLVLNGDIITQADIGGLLALHEREGNEITVGVKTHLHTVPFGVVALEGDRITEIMEKPTESWTINAGIYVLNPEILSLIPGGESFAMTDLVEAALEQGKAIGAFPIEEEWIDVGRRVDLSKARGEE